MSDENEKILGENKDLEQEKEQLSEKDKVKRVNISQKDLPRASLKDAIPFARSIYENVANGSMSLEDLAKLNGVGPKSPRTKYIVWGAEAYGIIQKNEKNEYFLTEVGRKIIKPTYPAEDNEAKIKAILTPTLLSKFYIDYNKHPIPQDNYFANMLETKYKIPKERVDEAKNLIIENGEFTGIIKQDSKSGKSMIDLDEPIVSQVEPEVEPEEVIDKNANQSINASNTSSEWEKTCFIACPIGEETSIERKHLDMIYKHLIKPVMDELGFELIRADKIEKSGIITQQILEYIIKSKLCIVDLSFNNPNVFYELGVRHMSQQPSIQIIKKGDKIPFDVSQGRTIIIDTSDVYTLIDRIESAKKELNEYVKAIVSNSENVDDNPIKVYVPGIKIIIP